MPLICGRYARFIPQHEYSQLFRAANMVMLSPRYNVAPSQAVLVARNSEWGDYRQLATSTGASSRCGPRTGRGPAR